MSLPDLYGTFYPDLARAYQSQQLENPKSFSLYKGETFNGDFLIYNSGTEKTEAFDIDLYISVDEAIDTNDYYIGTYTLADGIEGKSSYSVSNSFYTFINNSVSAKLPNSEDVFWKDVETYYVGAIVDPDNVIAESDENNNSPDFSYFRYFDSSTTSTSNPISVKEADLPVVSLTQNENILNINLSEPAPENGFTIDYRNIIREDYLNGLATPTQDTYQYWHRYIGSRFYDLEFNRLYITKESYYDLADYQYYDANGGYYAPDEDKYFNADGSYYDVGERLFYDANGNAIELTDNSVEYLDFSSSPRHYLVTGGYISLISGIYYDAYGGYIDEETEEYFRGESANGLGRYSIKIDDLTTRSGAFEFGFGLLPVLATPNVDYEIVPGENIVEITDTTITIAPGETTATIDFNFLEDLVFDPNETIEFELLANDQKYLVGRSSLYRYIDYAYRLDLEDLQNPASGNYNFSVASNAEPGTVIGRVNLSNPQGDKLIYSLIKGQPKSASDLEEFSNNYSNINFYPDFVRTSNQDLDGDGIYPFSIDSATGVITLSDFDDLDREASNNIGSNDLPQLYNAGYYQLFVLVADQTIAENNTTYPIVEWTETSLVNIKVLDLAPTIENDNLRGFTTSDNIDGLAGNDTIYGLAGNDTLWGNEGSDRLIGGIGNDRIDGGVGNDVIFALAGHDTMMGREGDDRLHGQSGNDIIEGGAGNDTLFGGNQFDRLDGGDGDDYLDGGKGITVYTGGTGEDTFILNKDSVDWVRDFQLGRDTIGLADGLTFAKLEITGRVNSFIAIDGNRIGVLLDINPDDLDISSFVEV